MVVISRNPVHSVLWLIVTFFAISGSLYFNECPVPGYCEPDRVCRRHHGTVPVRDHVDEPECRNRTQEEQVAEDGGRH